MSSSRVQTTLTGSAGRLRDVHRLAHEVGRRRRAPAEAAAEERGVDRRPARASGPRIFAAAAWSTVWNCVPVQISHLSAADPHGAVERLHRRVREVRERRTRPRRPCARRRHAPPSASPAAAAVAPGVCGELAVLARAAPSVSSAAARARVPLDRRARRARLRRPEVLGDDRDAGRDLTTTFDAGHRQRLGAVEALHACRRSTASARRRAVSRPGNCTSMPNCARAGDLLGRVEPLRRLADERPVLRRPSASTVVGGGSFAAASASSPKRRALRRRAMTTPFSARQSAGAARSTAAAAACTSSVARHRADLAVAVELGPACVVEPPVICMPKTVCA